jgi:signal peptide peptidase-like protein 2B
VTYLLHFDRLHGLKGKDGYFLPGVIGYAVGMVMCDAALLWAGSGQPALLYLVPTTLGVTALLAKQRGHWDAMWDESSPPAEAAWEEVTSPLMG